MISGQAGFGQRQDREGGVADRRLPFGGQPGRAGGCRAERRIARAGNRPRPRRHRVEPGQALG